MADPSDDSAWPISSGRNDRHYGNNAQRVWCREEQPQILRRSAPQDDSAGNCLFLSTPFGYSGYLGYLGHSTINNLCVFSRSLNRALIQGAGAQAGERVRHGSIGGAAPVVF